MDKLHSAQKQMKHDLLTLKQDCPTRWNLTYEMLNRLIKTKEPLQCALTLLAAPAEKVLNQAECHAIEKASEILKCFDEVTVEVSS